LIVLPVIRVRLDLGQSPSSLTYRPVEPPPIDLSFGTDRQDDKAIAAAGIQASPGRSTRPWPQLSKPA
jgi:hypothetical protein